MTSQVAVDMYGEQPMFAGFAETMRQMRFEWAGAPRRLCDQQCVWKFVDAWNQGGHVKIRALEHRRGSLGWPSMYEDISGNVARRQEAGTEAGVAPEARSATRRGALCTSGR